MSEPIGQLPGWHGLGTARIPTPVELAQGETDRQVRPYQDRNRRQQEVNGVHAGELLRKHHTGFFETGFLK
jgi:hypothetical protein